jgi:hypothetical protein
MSNAVTSGSQFIVPLYSTLDASGSATMDVVQLENVSMPYDYRYNVNVDEPESADLLNGFVVTHEDGVVIGCTAARSEGPWKAVLQRVIEDAQDPSGNSLADDLYNEALAQFKSIFTDAIANVLQDNWILNVNLDAAGGAANMWDDLVASPAACRLLAQQIPNSNYLLYSDASENMVTNALPMKNGDKIVFIFDVTMLTITRNIQDIQQASSFSPPAGVTPSDVDPNTNATPAVTTASFSNRKAAFFVTVAGTGWTGEAALSSTAAAAGGQVAGLVEAQQVTSQTQNPASGGSGGSTSGAGSSSL